MPGSDTAGHRAEEKTKKKVACQQFVCGIAAKQTPRRHLFCQTASWRVLERKLLLRSRSLGNHKCAHTPLRATEGGWLAVRVGFIFQKHVINIPHDSNNKKNHTTLKNCRGVQNFLIIFDYQNACFFPIKSTISIILQF